MDGAQRGVNTTFGICVRHTIIGCNPEFCQSSVGSPLLWYQPRASFPRGCSLIMSAFCFPNESIKQTNQELLYFYTAGCVTLETPISLFVLHIIPHSCIFWRESVKSVEDLTAEVLWYQGSESLTHLEKSYNINKQYALYNTKSTGDCKATEDATWKSLFVLDRVDHKTLITVE